MSSQEVPRGYKQTRVGVIPVDWEVRKLGEVTYIDKQNLTNKTNEDFEFKYISLSDVDNGKISKDLKIYKYRNAPSRAKRVIIQNDILLATVRPNLKGFAQYKGNEKNIICSTGFAVIRSKKNISQDFIYNNIFSLNIEKQIFALVVGSNYPAINSKDVKNLKIPLPPLKEQQKIAEILTTWDDAISNVELLILNYELRKKGLMQKLLSGEVRFAGFNGEWEEVNLKDIASTSIGLVTTMTKSYAETGVPLIRNSDIKPNKIRKEKLIYLNHDFANKHENRKLKINDIVTVHTGEIGVSAIIDKSLNGCHGFATLNTRIIDENVLPEYICWYFNSEKNINFAFSMATGDGRSNFNLKDFNRTKIPLPSFQEQQQIVEVLNNADKEINLLKNELNELKEQKKGLMQKLLTGEMRVKI